MSWLEIVALIAGFLLVIAIIWWVRTARRLDGLHRTVVQSRAMLGDALAERARESSAFAACRALDMAGAILLAEAAAEATEAEHLPLVDDGLVLRPAPKRTPVDRRLLESNLSRTLRLVLEDLPAEELTDEQNTRLSKLNEAREDVRLSRRFHNTKVDQARRLRSGRLVRLTKMAGRAGLPEPVDMDDE
ncbi:MAG: hypothetical protein Q4P33_02165 [Flaviflexus sp.]|nr:hypothetical protein [Flaviflexus sp.]